MTAEIWNTYEMVGATITGVLAGGVPAIAFMILARRDGQTELAAANTAWSNALEVQAANDRARWAPAYSPNLFAPDTEPDDPDVTGEVIAVMSSEVPTSDDLDAPDDDTDRRGLRLVLLAIPAALWERLRDAWSDWRRSRRERDQVGSGERVLYDEDELRAHGMGEEEVAAFREGFVKLPSVGAKVHALGEVLRTSSCELDDEIEIEAWQAVNPPSYTGRRRREEQSTSTGYTGRRVHRDYVTGVFPAVALEPTESGTALLPTVPSLLGLMDGPEETR